MPATRAERRRANRTLRAASAGGLIAGLIAGLCWGAVLGGGLLLAGCNELFPHRSEGEKLYREHCADCHGLDGRGNTVREMGQPYADLTDDSWKFGGEDSSIANAIREGSFGLMPAYQEKLNEQQIQALVAYLKVLRRLAAGNTSR
jgi:mono/diheme cytochrome c family protein